MSFYTTEEQAYELFSRAGEIKKIVMGLDKNTKTPCGFCFITKEDNGDVVEVVARYEMNIAQTMILVEVGTEKLVQKELEAQRQLVDYGAGSLGSFPSVMPSQYGRNNGRQGYGGFDMVEEIIRGRGIGKMTVSGQRSLKELRIMILVEILITTPDRRRIHVSVRVVILILMKMIEKDALSCI